MVRDIDKEDFWVVTVIFGDRTRLRLWDVDSIVGSSETERAPPSTDVASAWCSELNVDLGCRRVEKPLRSFVLGNIVEDQPPVAPVDSEGITWDTGVTVERLVEGIEASEMVAVEFRKDVLFEYADLTISA